MSQTVINSKNLFFLLLVGLSISHSVSGQEVITGDVGSIDEEQTKDAPNLVVEATPSAWSVVGTFLGLGEGV